MILHEFEEQFGGQAAAEAATQSGQLTVAFAMADALERIGEVMARP